MLLPVFFHRSNRRPQGQGLKCPACKYTSFFQSDLVRHVKRMHTARTHECDECTAQFAYQGDLNNHKKVSFGIKPLTHDAEIIHEQLPMGIEVNNWLHRLF